MFPYLALFFCIIILSIPFNNKHIVKYHKFFLLTCTFFLTLFSGLASSRGDYLSYKRAFSDPFSAHYEIGFKYFNLLIYNMTGSYHVMLIIVAFFSVLCKLIAFRKLSPLLGLSCIVYVGVFFVPADMGSIRAGLASSLFLLSIPYIKKNDFVKFSCFILIGSAIHSVMLIAYSLYFMNIFSLKRQHYILLLIFILLVYSQINITSLVYSLEGFIPGGYNIVLIKKTLSYISRENKAIVNFALIKRLFIFFSMTIFFTKLKKQIALFEILYNSYFLSIIFYMLFSISFTLANRISWFFSIVEPILLSGFVRVSSSNVIKFFIVFLIITFSVISLYHMLKTQTDPPFNLYLPYRLFFL
jgi:hypothetical protein